MTDERDQHEDAVYIHVENFLATKVSTWARAAVMDLLLCVYWPIKQPFVYDPESLSDRLNAMFPKRNYSPEIFERIRPELGEFFVELDDGRWAPSPKYFSLTDGNAELLAAGLAN